MEYFDYESLMFTCPVCGLLNGQHRSDCDVALPIRKKNGSLTDDFSKKDKQEQLTIVLGKAEETVYFEMLKIAKEKK
jgi:hypothetical protein